jgi:hypothetical protein
MQIAHTVKAGEDIGVIANLYGVDYKEILADNNLGAYDPIEPNDVIEVNITEETITPGQYEKAGAEIESDLAEVDRMSATRLARSPASPYVGEDLEEPAVELESVADADASTEEKDLLDRIWNSVKSGAKQVFGQDEGVPPEAAAQELTDTGEDKSNILVRDQNITGDGVLSLEAQAALKQVEDVKEDEGEVVPDLETGMKPVPLKVETEEVDLVEKPATTPLETATVSYDPPEDEDEDKGKVVPVADTSIQQIQQNIGGTITNPVSTKIYEDAVKFINDMGPTQKDLEGGFRFYFGDNKEDYELLRSDINEKVESYETKIADIAAEKQKPPLEGTNMWLAIIGVALGAAGSALNRTPNEAMQMLNSFLDREQQKFLKSKEMKMKSAENQRLDLIRQRGELLQAFQNETNRALQISQFQLQKTGAMANINAIKDRLVQAADKTKQDYGLAVGRIIKDLIVSENTVRAAMGKSERERYVPGIVLFDEDGNPVPFESYQTLTEKEGPDHRTFNGLMKATTMKLDQMEKLLKKPDRFMPSMFSETSAKLVGYGADLETLFKALNNFGANYSEKEIQLNIAQIPQFNDNKFQNLLGRAEKTMRFFRSKLIEDYTARMHSQGASPKYAKVEKKKEKELEDLGAKGRYAGN